MGRRKPVILLFAEAGSPGGRCESGIQVACVLAPGFSPAQPGVSRPARPGNPSTPGGSGNCSTGGDAGGGGAAGESPAREASLRRDLGGDDEAASSPPPSVPSGGHLLAEMDHQRKGYTIYGEEVEMQEHRQIIEKIIGISEIIITETTASCVDTIFWYKGKVRAGNEAYSEAMVLAFDRYEEVVALHDQLSLFSHPGIMSSLGFGCGVGVHLQYTFLAFPCFESTLANYMDKSCNRTMQLARFTEDFIKLIECVVKALLELHNHGFYCPNLVGKKIAIVKEYDSLCAKLWDICKLESGDEARKDQNWVSLGKILKMTAQNHKSYTPEIADLCQQLINGTLKGSDILLHSALLCVRVKFDNILALHTFASKHCKEVTHPGDIPKANIHCSASDQDNTMAIEQLFCDSLDKNKIIASLEKILDYDVGWKEKVPKWMSERIVEAGFQLPAMNTFRQFLWEIRCLIEHENKYVPPEIWNMKFANRGRTYSLWLKSSLQLCNYSHVDILRVEAADRCSAVTPGIRRASYKLCWTKVMGCDYVLGVGIVRKLLVRSEGLLTNFAGLKSWDVIMFLALE
ncbi:hypothetical protein ACP70R_002677 [Stipagrostis hirtigluma subsp. patula]